jgi:hypothetical protein
VGFFDFIMSMFGGGAKIAVDLTSDRVSMGGILSGKVTLTGAAKDYTADDVKVQLVYVHTEKQDDSPIPKIDVRVLIDQTIATNVDLPAEKVSEFDFQINIPGGLEVTAHNVAYQVKATADIKGIKDPSVTVKLEVFENEGGDGLTADKLFQRWPALRGAEDSALEAALRDMRWKHDVDSPEDDLRVAEPVLIKLMDDHENTGIRFQAFEVWANIVGDALRSEHIDRMDAFAKTISDNPAALAQVLSALGRGADLGSERVLKQYLDHASADVRVAAVQALGWGSGGSARAKVLLPMLQDEDAKVRRAAVNALSSMKDETGVKEGVITLALSDDDPEILSQALSTLAMLWHTPAGVAEVRPVYERARTHNDPIARKAWVNWCAWPAEADDITDCIEAALRDQETDVAEAMAFEFTNLLRRDHGKKYATICQNSALDANFSDEIRGRCAGSLAGNIADNVVTDLYTKIVAEGASATLQRQLVEGLKFEVDDSPALKQLLGQFTSSEYKEVAERAQRYID